MPVQALWGANGLVGRTYDVVGVWSEYADHAEGQAVPGGHFVPEEAPNEAADALVAFLKRN
jgi:haloacetate dehalogenase